jgi:hypothetical protein
MTGVTIVHCGDGVPAEALAWDAPSTVDDDGSATWYFEGIGDYQAPDVLGYSVTSYTELPEGLDPQYASDLQPLPSVLADEIAFLSEECFAA